MAKRESLAVLQDKYNIPDCDLESLGLKPVDKIKLSTKITQFENKLLDDICYEQRISRAQFLTCGVIKILSDEGMMEKIGCSKVECVRSKYGERWTKTICFDVETKIALAFRQHCKKFNITMSQILRAYIMYCVYYENGKGENQRGDI